MRSLLRPLALALVVCALVVNVAADDAKSLYTKGKLAEDRQQFEQAYELYKQAFDKKPSDVRYRASYERMRFLAGSSHTHRGQLLRSAGQLEQALAEFQKAAEIDSSSAIAQQEIRRTTHMIESAKSGSPISSAPRAGQKGMEAAQGPVELSPIANVPVTLKMTEDSKVIYETVGKLAGINVLFDPDYTSRRIHIDLNGVSLQEALEIIALESKTFWRAVTGNTIFIAADNPAKRKDIEQSVIRTFYLANLSQPTELQDVVNALRQILEIPRIQPLPSQGALVVRGTPDQIALAEKLIGDLDKAKPEVLVEVAIMQVSRDKTRNLGLSPPTTASVSLNNNVTSNTSNSSTNSSTSSTSSSGNGINLNRLANLNATDFSATIGSASVTALYSDSDVKLIQNPQLRALDGQKATLKIGDRVPVATGSYQSGGISGSSAGGISPLVSTQFQYLDVGVNVEVTPKVHQGGEVTLKVSIDVSSVTSYSNIGGISEPVIGQRKIEHEIRLKEGESNLMGGILEDQDTKSLSGFPGLAKIPILRYFFAQSDTERKENEIVFVLTPHIVRGQELSELNQRSLGVGTANAISVRRSSPPQPGPGARNNAVPPAVIANPAMAPVAQPVTPAQSQSPEGSGGNASFVFDPPSVTQPQGSTFAVNVLLNGVQNAYSVPLQVSYDSKLLQVVNVSNGGFLSQDGQPVAVVHREDEDNGNMQITATRPPGASGISGQGAVVTLTFLAKTTGQSTLTISKGGARDPNMQPIPVAGTAATVTVQ